MTRKRYLIVGDGGAGFTAAQTLRTLDRSATIAILSDESSPAYFRAALTNFLLGELREDQIWAVTPDFYEKWGIHRVFTRVVDVDAANARVTASTWSAPEAYDALIVASGARARPPKFAGAHVTGVMTLRTIQDVHRVLEWIRSRRLERAVVLGGGALGLEWAHGLKERGVAVTILERSPQFLPGALDKVASDLLAARLKQSGIDVRLGTEVTEAYAGNDGSLTGVMTSAGETLWCQLLAVAIGVEPNSGFLARSGVTLTERGAVAVDRGLNTGIPGIWAAGDVASVEGYLPQLWEPARRQALIAARNVVGHDESYSPGVSYFSTRLFDLDFAAVGTLFDADDERTDFPKGTGKIAYRKLTFRDGRLIGVLMLGEREAHVRARTRAMKRLVDERTDVSAVRDQLLDPTFDIEGWLEARQKSVAPKPARAGSLKPANVRRTKEVRLAPEPRPKGTAVVGAGLADGLVAGTVAIAIPQPEGTPARAPVAGAGGVPVGGPKQTVPLTDHGPRETRVLSIGLNAEAPLPASGEPIGIDARLEGAAGSWTITRPVTIVGSDPSADVAIADSALAPQHAQILRYGDALYLRDLGSRTGTWVNGVALANAHALGDGDSIHLGATQLVFRSTALGPNVPPDVSPAERAPRLEIRSGASLGLSFLLGPGPAIVGRAPDAAIRIDDPGVGWHHASMRETGGQFSVTTLPGAHGTWKGGVALSPHYEVPLADGDVLRLGDVDVLFTTAPRPGGTRARLRGKARLHVDAGSLAGRSFVLGDRTLVGSQAGCTIALGDAGVAPSHVEIALTDQGPQARDLSGGATFLRGAPLASTSTPLHDGDVLLLGSGVMLRFEETP